MEVNCPFPPNSKVVAYLRDSGGDDQDLSTIQQEAKLKEWCEENNLVLVEVFRDDASPGSSVIVRDAFLEMIDYFHSPDCKARGIVLWTLSRFARNQNDSQYYKADLRRRGFIVHSINDNIPDTTDGKVFEAMIDWMNQKYLEDLSREVKRGLHHIVKEFGAVPGNPPVGFKRHTKVIGVRRDGAPHNISTWVFDDDLIPLVKAAWKMRAEGHPVEEIDAKYHLYKNKSSYSHFFRNKIYLGDLEYGNTRIPNFCEPLITREVWDRVQAINLASSMSFNPKLRTGNPNHPRRLGGTFLLSGILYCSKCGNLMRGKIVEYGGKKRNDYYVCTGRVAKFECDAQALPKDAIEKAVIEKVADFIRDPQTLIYRDQKNALQQETQRAEIKAKIKVIQHELHENRRRANNLVNVISDGSAAPQLIMDRLRDLEHVIAKQDSEVARLDALLKKDTPYVRTRAEAEELASKLLVLLTSENAIEKRTFIRSIVYRVDAAREDTKIKGTTFFHEENNEISEAPPDLKKLMPID